MAVYLWKCVAVLCCLTLSSCQQQIKLEDIEQDTLTNEKQQDVPPPPPVQQGYQQDLQQNLQQNLQAYQQSYQQPQQQQPPAQQAYLPQGTLQQLPPRQYFALPAAPPQQPAPQPPQPQGPPQQNTGPHLFAPGARNFPRPPPIQLQFPSRLPQQQILSIPLYLQQPQQQYQFPYLQDNSLQDIYNVQPLYSPSTPQYVYVQQPSASSTIPVNNKQGSIEYVQYVDPNTNLVNNPKTQAVLQNYHHRANHNLAGLIQRNAYTNVLPVNYRQPAPQSYRLQGNPQPLVNQNLYVIPPPQPLQQPTNQIHGIPQSQNQILAQQRYLVPAQFAPQPQSPFVEPHQAQQSTQNIVFQKREPQNLLESYVPSVLQIQYYKQLQQQQNAVQNDAKIEDIVGKN